MAAVRIAPPPFFMCQLFFADLDIGLGVRVVGRVRHNGFSMEAKGSLEHLNRIKIQIAHGDEGSGCIRRTPGLALIHLCPETSRTQFSLYHGNMAGGVVVHIKFLSVFVGVKHADLDRPIASPMAICRFSMELICRAGYGTIHSIYQPSSWRTGSNGGLESCLGIWSACEGADNGEVDA